MDVSQRIMRFLPPQDLLNFVKSSKRMLEHLTMDIAVMSSLFYGKRSNELPVLRKTPIPVGQKPPPAYVEKIDLSLECIAGFDDIGWFDL